MSREVDVAIIGAGSAGLFALSRVRRSTDNFVLIDGGELGTTCARVGCMPSKVLIQVAEDFHRRKIFDREGIDGAESLEVDMEAALEHVQDLRDVFVDKTLATTDELGPEHLIEAHAHFVSADTIEAGGETIKAKTFIIATGSSPVVPAEWEEFRDKVITTDEFFELENLPASVAVVGLGVVGLEIGQAMHRLGVEVTGFDMQTSIGGLSDEAVNQLAVATLGKEMPMHLGVAAEVKAMPEGLTVTAGEHEVSVEAVFASLGRRPNLEKLQLQAAGIECDERGMPDFDENTMRINGTNIFIAGDVDADRPVLHEAGHEGRVAGINAAKLISGQQPVAYARKAPLSITFCDPNIANIGARLDELDEAATAIGEIQFGPVGRALIMGKNRGLLRIYVNKRDGKLMGASMACAKAENLAHLIAWSIQQQLSVFDLLKMPFYHPVIEEALQAALYSVLSELEVSEDQVELEEL